MAYTPATYPYGQYPGQYPGMFPGQFPGSFAGIPMSTYPSYYPGYYPYGGTQAGKIQYALPHTNQIWVPLSGRI
jgi:hypothetical protein